MMMRFSLQPPYTQHQKNENTTKSKVAVHNHRLLLSSFPKLLWNAKRLWIWSVDEIFIATPIHTTSENQKHNNIKSRCTQSFIFLEQFFQYCYGMQRCYEFEMFMRFSLQPPYTPHQKIKNTTKSKVAVQKQSCTQMRNPIQAFQILWKPWIVHMHFYMPVLMFWQDGCFFENAKILTPKIFFGRVTS